MRSIARFGDVEVITIRSLPCTSNQRTLSSRSTILRQSTFAWPSCERGATNSCAWLSTDTGKPSRSEEHTSELQSLMRTSYAVFCLQKKKNNTQQKTKKN